MVMTAAEGQLAFAPRPGGIGADVAQADFSRPFTPAQVAALKEAVARYRVLFFHGQHIDSATHLARARQFGELEIHPFAREKAGRVIFSDPDEPALVVVESLPGKPSVAEKWHSDVTFMTTPSMGSLLRMTHRPESGGNTRWADMAAAYRGLDEETRRLIDDAVAVHDWHIFRRNMAGLPEEEQRLEAMRAQMPPVEHPVVRTHPLTGERLIYVNRNFTVRIKGMAEEASADLLEYLYAQAENPAYHAELEWEVDDIAFWDNRITQHSVKGDVVGHRRLERVSIVGDRPF